MCIHSAARLGVRVKHGDKPSVQRSGRVKGARLPTLTVRVLLLTVRRPRRHGAYRVSRILAESVRGGGDPHP